MWIFIAPFIYIAFCAGASSVLGPADPKVNNPPAKIEKANPEVRSASEPQVPVQVPQAIPAVKSPV